MAEQEKTWRPVVGWEGLYEVSDAGDVARVTKQGRRIRSLVSDKSGHLRVNLSHEGNTTTCKVHQLVAEAFLGPRGGLHTRHLNGIPDDNRVENLAYGTPHENAMDTIRYGGWDDRNKLTADDVREIRRLHRAREKHHVIAERFGVCRSYVSKLARGEKWAWLDDINYDELDPGIRDAVRQMRGAGFETTDSGDGSKAATMECALPFPNIFAMGSPETMVSDCEQLQAMFPDATVEASWSVGGPLILMVMWPNGGGTNGGAL